MCVSGTWHLSHLVLTFQCHFSAVPFGNLASTSNLGPRLRPVAFRGVAISLPPIETADQFAHLIAQRQQFQSCLCRGVATDAVAVADIDLGRVERFDRIETDRLVGQIDRARNTLFG